MKTHSKTLYIKNGLEVSVYFNIGMLLIFTCFIHPVKEKERRWALQIGILGMNLRITYFNK